MATQTMRKISPSLSPQSRILVKQARSEIERRGKTDVRCPKCGSEPLLTTTEHGERTMLCCDCGYIFDEEINF